MQSYNIRCQRRDVTVEAKLTFGKEIVLFWSILFVSFFLSFLLCFICVFKPGLPDLKICSLTTTEMSF